MTLTLNIDLSAQNLRCRFKSQVQTPKLVEECNQLLPVIAKILGLS